VIGDDLTSLFTNPDPDSAFRQGQIVDFNLTTGANRVRVGGAELIDLPILVGGDTVNLRGESSPGAGDGDVVIVLKYAGSWAILGRIVQPGAGTLAQASVDFDTGYAADTTVANMTTSFATRGSHTFDVPSWANNAIVLATSVANLQNTSAAAGYAELITDINGSGGSQSAPFMQPTDQLPVVHTQARELFSADQGGSGSTLLGSTITCNVRVKTTTGTWTNGFRNSALSAIALYRRVR
jgi:hypothetical protein